MHQPEQNETPITCIWDAGKFSYACDLLQGKPYIYSHNDHFIDKLQMQPSRSCFRALSNQPHGQKQGLAAAALIGTLELVGARKAGGVLMTTEHLPGGKKSRHVLLLTD
jgi:hypothetical protein